MGLTTLYNAEGNPGGRGLPAEGVPDTPHNQEVRERMKREIENLPPGTIVDIPADWAQMPEAERS